MTGGRGFSLVELLVVIGVIALLVAILLPAVRGARESGNRVACLAKLRGVIEAAHLHVNEHDGYLPVAGWHWHPAGGATDPAGLGDRDERRYDYYAEGAVRRPLPLTAALAKAAGVAVGTDSRAAVEAALAGDAVAGRFRCPSQQDPLTGVTQRGGEGGWNAPLEASSYVFNEALLGKRDVKAGRPNPVMGKLSAVRRPAEVFFAMDGRPRNMTNDNFFLAFDLDSRTSFLGFYNVAMQPDNGFGKQTLDFYRHRRRMNVVFCDAHAETLDMTDAALDAIGVSRGIY